MAQLKVTQLRGKVGLKQNQRETLRTLGLKRIGDVVVKGDPGHGQHGPSPRDGRGGQLTWPL